LLHYRNRACRCNWLETGVKGVIVTQLQDRYGRTIDYLRISITDHCNLRCRYCVPFSGRPKLEHRDILTYEELLRVVRVAVAAGISKVRLTGGEPLMRSGVVDFCARLSAIPGLEEITLTTNGVRLAEMAADLCVAGISRINISLDTLDRQRFIHITGKDRLDEVLRGIQQAEAVGMTPIKINAVAQRGINDDEIVTLARLTLDKPYHIRFIELMPTSGWGAEAHKAHFMPVDEIKERVLAIGPLEPASVARANGPARTYRLPDALGTVGFIAALSNHFCGTCNRLRLTADGHLRACLFSEAEIDLKGPLRQGATEEALAEIFVTAIRTKPMGHHCNDAAKAISNGRIMQAIGG
jgi:cyclic pyranopterin phosphate synthase